MVVPVIALGQGLSGLAAGGTIAILSGVLFGAPHWFGNPSRLPGVLMAGFLGWLMATSMIQTGGIAWAWGIHALQNVVILAILIASAEAHRRGLIRNPVAAMPGRQGEANTQEP
jgi:membrane protease YdiL (CAAX protease family)